MNKSIEALLNLAKAFSSHVELTKDVNDRFLVSIRYVSYKENRYDIMARSIFGCGDSIENACEDFLNKAKGRILFGDSELFYGKTRPEYICL